MIELQLFLAFLRVGCFSFGGGYGSVPLIRDVVFSHGWMTDAEFTSMVAISESSPGPIMVNLATYVGCSQAGFWGAVFATFAVVLPAFFIIVIISSLLTSMLKNRLVQAVLGGLKPCIVGVILATGIHMILQRVVLTGASAAVDGKAVLITIILSVILFGSKPLLKKKISAMQLIAIAAICGILIY